MRSLVRILGIAFVLLSVRGSEAAAPTVEGSNTSSLTTQVTSHTVNLPASIVSGETLLCFFAIMANSTIDWPAGWTEIYEQLAGDNSTELAVAWRKADGAEGASLTVTTGAIGRSAHNCYRISGATDPTVTPPEAATETQGQNSPASPGSLSPTGGSKEYVWFAAFSVQVTGAPACIPIISTYPTNYTNGVFVTSGGGSAQEARLGVARRALTASSEDPGDFTFTGTDCSVADWNATTVAVHPAGAAPSPSAYFFRRR